MPSKENTVDLLRDCSRCSETILCEYTAAVCVPCYNSVTCRHEVLLKALEKIAKAEGPFSRDPLQHATNTIQDMVAIAEAAIDKSGRLS